VATTFRDSIALWGRRHVIGHLPPRLRRALLGRIPLLDARTQWWQAKNPYRDEPPYSTYESPYPVTLGIVPEFWHRHQSYIAACKDLRVSYRLVNLLTPNWVAELRRSGCHTLMTWPSVQVGIWKALFDERLKVAQQVFGMKLHPQYDALWLYESKRRMAYWLQAHGIPHAMTWIFYDQGDARAFARDCALPIVFKTDRGARASGVHIIRNRDDLVRLIDRVFRKGILHGDGEARDYEWGSVILQRYIPDAREWRVIRIGESYFAHQKLKSGEYHSGSDMVGWTTPSNRLLDFVREVTEIDSFESIDIDIFEDQNGSFLVNELQALFGAFREYQMLVDGKPGRYLWSPRKKMWTFEEGFFCHNACCNLRVAHVMKQDGYDVELPTMRGQVSDMDRISQSNCPT